MPRYSRKEIHTQFLHVLTQGINRSFIFQEDIDKKYYIKIMYKIKQDYNIKIIAYCIMNNHAHILVQIDKIEDLSKYMQRLNTKYSMYYNSKFDRVGYVFRDRYKSEGICNEEYLQHCIKYIYDNPVKAGICEKAIDYPFSNYHEISTNSNNIFVFLDTEETIEKEIQNTINVFCRNNSIDKIQLKKDKKKLKEIIIILTDLYQISFRKIALELNIGRETIRNNYGK